MGRNTESAKRPRARPPGGDRIRHHYNVKLVRIIRTPIPITMLSP